MGKTTERRSISSRFSSSSDGRKLVGLAAVWDQPAEIREGGRTFTEIVRRSAFTRSLDSGRDVLVCFNHDPDKLLGRTASGTATITATDAGLQFEVLLPDTPTGNEVRELVQRGDLTGASFTFAVQRDNWEGSTRELLDVELFECGPVTMPAYSQTNGTVGIRSKLEFYKLKLKLRELQ